ncbi:Tumor necrosis factor receptor superfamily member 5 [Channa argus]|uniref:Tumor necrosis factor receptor superfamily member 5 n=1 Tax=Channa argus TaxID=215402 RepID=A0A6G1Q3U3_CHAAH|nr:Tumor necrosis factor receptor superfamily member 5 [Channa argus]
MLLLATAWWAFLVVAAAQPSCDPETQYESGGACCMMCGPGTSMLPSGTCSNPQCKDCEENEYQDKYTQEPKCLRQPYCDPNKNFEVTTHLSKKVQSTCLCRTGFHCSSEACITCVQHTECGPGHEVVSKGNHTYDTGCVESCRGEEQTETPREIYIPIADMHEPEHKFVEQFSTQEEGSTQEGHGMTPEENLDEESLEQSSYPRTENGNFVTQERGKSEVLSRQESQTQTPTFTGSFFTTT